MGDGQLHVAGDVAVAVAVVAFPLAVDGAFLTAAIAVAAGDVEKSSFRHCELRRKARIADRLG
jgi:hypothetical protein